jgi:hypothetical protein
MLPCFQVLLQQQQQQGCQPAPAVTEAHWLAGHPLLLLTHAQYSQHWTHQQQLLQQGRCLRLQRVVCAAACCAVLRGVAPAAAAAD